MEISKFELWWEMSPYSKMTDQTSIMLAFKEVAMAAWTAGHKAGWNEYAKIDYWPDA